MRGEHARAKNARTGLILFFLYLFFYAGFVYLSAFSGTIMSRKAFAGVNMAVLYGFGLIVAAFVFAMIYLKLCLPSEDAHHGEAP